MMKIRNPTYTVDGRIDCEIEHPKFSWVPFTADKSDVEEYGRAIYASALKMGPATYVPQEIDAATKLKILREKRNSALAASDWTQMPDSPLSDAEKQDWATYRQALRDLPDTDGAVWPTEPGVV